MRVNSNTNVLQPKNPNIFIGNFLHQTRNNDGIKYNSAAVNNISIPRINKSLCRFQEGLLKNRKYAILQNRLKWLTHPRKGKNPEKPRGAR